MHAENVERRPTLAKLTRPKLARIHPRKRLFQRLDGAAREGLVWVQGPPGAGKTALVASWLADRSGRALWIQLDAGDGDVAGLFHYLTLAARSYLPSVALPLFSQESLITAGVFARAFFRALFAVRGPPLLLVLDDYQTLPADSEVHAALAEGLEECPPGSVIVVMSRADPPAAWSRLRLNGRLEMVSPEELMLTRQESGGISALWNNSRGVRQAETLRERSGGWAAGLVLLLAAGPKESVGSVERPLFDYFAEEVMARADSETRSVLLATSLLPDVSEKMAIELSGVQRAGEVLSRLARQGYFTARLDGPSPAYRYHPLFQDFLRQRASAEWGEQTRALQAKAARLLARAGHAEEALDLACQAGIWDEVEQLLLGLAPDLLQTGRVRRLRDWAGRLPPERVERNAWLRYWLGLSLFPIDPPAALRMLEPAYEAFEKADDFRGRAMAWAAIAEIHVYTLEDLSPLDRWITRLEEVDRAVQGADPDTEGALAAAAVAAMVHRQPQNPSLARWVNRALELTLTRTGAFRFTMGRHLLMYYGWWCTSQPKARLILDALAPMIRSPETDPSNAILCLVVEADSQLEHADPERCIENVALGLKVAADSGVHLWDPFLLCVRVWAELLKDDVAAAERALLPLAQATVKAPRMMRMSYHYVSGMVAYRARDSMRAREESKVATQLATEAGMPMAQAAARVTWALANDIDRRDPFDLTEAARWCHDTGYRYGEFACLSALAARSLRDGSEADARRRLAEALRIGGEIGVMNLIWFGARDWSDLCALALQSGIETEYVSAFIRARKIPAGERASALESWPWALRVFTEGDISLDRPGKAGETVRKSQKKPLEMLQALVDAGPRGCTPEHLAGVLWPDADGDRALQALHSTMHRLRALIANPDVVICRGGRYALDAERVYVDAWASTRGGRPA